MTFTAVFINIMIAKTTCPVLLELYGRIPTYHVVVAVMLFNTCDRNLLDLERSSPEATSTRVDPGTNNNGSTNEAAPSAKSHKRSPQSFCKAYVYYTWRV